MGVAKSDFLRYVGADQILIENAERFARIDLDLSDFEKECNHYRSSLQKKKKKKKILHSPISVVWKLIPFVVL